MPKTVAAGRESVTDTLFEPKIEAVFIAVSVMVSLFIYSTFALTSETDEPDVFSVVGTLTFLMVEGSLTSTTARR